MPRERLSAEKAFLVLTCFASAFIILFFGPKVTGIWNIPVVKEFVTRWVPPAFKWILFFLLLFTLTSTFYSICPHPALAGFLLALTILGFWGLNTFAASLLRGEVPAWLWAFLPPELKEAIQSWYMYTGEEAPEARREAPSVNILTAKFGNPMTDYKIPAPHVNEKYRTTINLMTGVDEIETWIEDAKITLQGTDWSVALTPSLCTKATPCKLFKGLETSVNLVSEHEINESWKGKHTRVDVTTGYEHSTYGKGKFYVFDSIDELRSIGKDRLKSEIQPIVGPGKLETRIYLYSPSGYGYYVKGTGEGNTIELHIYFYVENTREEAVINSIEIKRATPETLPQIGDINCPFGNEDINKRIVATNLEIEVKGGEENAIEKVCTAPIIQDKITGVSSGLFEVYVNYTYHQIFSKTNLEVFE